MNFLKSIVRKVRGGRDRSNDVHEASPPAPPPTIDIYYASRIDDLAMVKKFVADRASTVNDSEAGDLVVSRLGALPASCARRRAYVHVCVRCARIATLQTA